MSKICTSYFKELGYHKGDRELKIFLNVVLLVENMMLSGFY